MKNPILAFRKTNRKQFNLIVNFSKYDILTGLNSNSVNKLKNNEEFSSTTITRTREAVDMSESS